MGIVIVQEGSSDSLGSLESEIYLHSLKLVLRQCSWIDSRLQFGYCIPSGNANQVADALSRRRNDVSGTKEVQELTGTLASLRLCAVTAEGETGGLEALEQANLLWRIRRAQDSDDALVKQIEIESIGYHKC